MGEWQPLPLYVGYGESGPGVALAHKCMTRHPFCLQYGTALYAMADIWLGAVTADVGGITPEYPDVVQHRGLFYKLPVYIQPVRIRASQGLVRNKPAVHLKYGAQPVVVSIIFVDYLLIFHLYYIFVWSLSYSSTSMISHQLCSSGSVPYCMPRSLW